MSIRPSLIGRCAALSRRLKDDTRALALLEFAFSFPLVMAMGGYGVEISNLALTHLRVSQYALNLADTASRVGIDSGLSTEQLREADINDVFQATRLESAGIKLTTYGRVTLSSLEGQSDGTQLLHWQRCIGIKSGTGYDSSYGTAGSGTAGTVVAGGMGDTDRVIPTIVACDTGSKVTSPPSSGVMFVEINYDYQPLLGKLFIGTNKIHYIASFIVRDKRDFTKVYNPAPTATASSCTSYTT